jgi:hypothetical protein
MKILTPITALLMMVGSIAPMNAAQDTPLAKQMETTSDAMKALAKETDPVKGAILAREAQDSVIKGLGLVPEMIGSMPDGEEKTKALADYRKMMSQAVVIFCDIEIAFVDKKLDVVAKLVADAKSLKKEGHNKYIEEE